MLRAKAEARDCGIVRKKLGVGRASLGSLSESVSIFDPEPLKEIAAELAAQLPQPSQGAFDPIGETLLSDGSRLRKVHTLEHRVPVDFDSHRPRADEADL